MATAEVLPCTLSTLRDCVRDCTCYKLTVASTCLPPSHPTRSVSDPSQPTRSVSDPSQPTRSLSDPVDGQVSQSGAAKVAPSIPLDSSHLNVCHHHHQGPTVIHFQDELQSLGTRGVSTCGGRGRRKCYIISSQHYPYSVCPPLNGESHQLSPPPRENVNTRRHFL